MPWCGLLVCEEHGVVPWTGGDCMLCNKKKGVLMVIQALELKDQLAELRDELTPLINDVQDMASNRPRSGAEITLGLRKLQEARMWFGVAEAMEKGLDPWANKIEEKE